MSLANPPKPVVTALCILVVITLGYLDWLTGPGISFHVFYLVPVGLATWYASRLAGLGVGLAAAAVWFTADHWGASDEHGVVIEAWNALFGLAAFWIVVVLLAKVKTMSQGLERNVVERTAALTEEVAERQRAEAAVRKLAMQLSEAEDAERARLAADLHDSIGQSLSVLKMNLGALTGPIAYDEGRPPGNLMESLGLIDDIVKQVRTFTFRISPATLQDLGLVPTLSWYADQFKAQAGTQVSVSETGERQTLPTSLATFLFRAVKELLNNSAKHGNAKEVVIAVHWKQGSVRIVIDDDGCGFDPKQVLAQPRHGLGLAGIRQRLLALHGELSVESTPGQGARVVLEINL